MSNSCSGLVWHASDVVQIFFSLSFALVLLSHSHALSFKFTFNFQLEYFVESLFQDLCKL